ncbi:MAG: hypothetical protein R6W73_00095 [Candidatus Saliniplasma sp.]
MVQDKGAAAVIVFLLVLSGLAGIISAQPNHHDFDEAEEDVEALYISLGRTIAVLESSLNHTLDVNLTVESNDGVEFEYRSENLEEALNLSREALDTVGYSEKILGDIEGEVSSYEYLENLYKPYSRSAQNITGFSETHIEYIDNLEKALEVYEDWKANETEAEYLKEGIDFLNRASYDLKDMNEYVLDAESYIDGIDDERLDNEALLGYISDIKDMLDQYDDFHRDILFLYQSIPSHMDLVVPSTAHPGEEITFYGIYIEEGVLVEGAEVELTIENSSEMSTVTDEDGFYSIDYKVPWDIGIRTVNLTVSINGLNQSAELDIVKYLSEIQLWADKEYYEQDIELQGEFLTDVQVPFDEISLNTTFNRSVEVSPAGFFALNYSSDIFPWGTSSIEVSYPGNETIEETNASISFDVNIPTRLSLESEIIGDTGEIEEVPIQGGLFNASSEEALVGSDVYLRIDDQRLENYTTDDDGRYSDDLSVDDIAPSDGLYILEAVFDGTTKYRSSVSDPIFIYIRGDVIGIGDDPDDIIDGDGDDDGDDDDDEHGLFPPDEEVGLVIVLVILITLISYYFIFYRKRSIEDEKEDTGKGDSIGSVSGPVLQIEGDKGLSAASKDDIPKIYHEFIERLKEKDDLKFKKGSTHRDIEREVSYKTGSDEIGTVTSIFEKAFFSSKEITKNEVQRFNEGMNTLNRVIG